MSNNNLDKQIIERYQDDERMMILVYAQWCINHDLDPIALYEEAYPNQFANETLSDVLDLTVSKAESDQIDPDMLLQALQVFGNHDLAFVVQRSEEHTSELQSRGHLV